MDLLRVSVGKLHPGKPPGGNVAADDHRRARRSSRARPAREAGRRRSRTRGRAGAGAGRVGGARVTSWRFAASILFPSALLSVGDVGGGGGGAVSSLRRLREVRLVLRLLRLAARLRLRHGSRGAATARLFLSRHLGGQSSPRLRRVEHLRGSLLLHILLLRGGLRPPAFASAASRSAFLRRFAAALLSPAGAFSASSFTSTPSSASAASSSSSSFCFSSFFDSCFSGSTGALGAERRARSSARAPRPRLRRPSPCHPPPRDPTRLRTRHRTPPRRRPPSQPCPPNLRGARRVRRRRPSRRRHPCRNPPTRRRCVRPRRPSQSFSSSRFSRASFSFLSFFLSFLSSCGERARGEGRGGDSG